MTIWAINSKDSYIQLESTADYRWQVWMSKTEVDKPLLYLFE